MGGGKSRTLCEDAFNNMLEHPGLVAVLARQSHTSIIGTTKKTMLGQVVPSQLIDRKKESQGEDWIQLWNGSVCHFIGLDDPIRWYSSELGWIGFDEAQEIKLDTAIRLITRLRQPLPSGSPAPCRASFTFNPSSPGHWLQKWFLDGEGLRKTEHGFYKPNLMASDDAGAPIGTCEFIFAKATDNIHLPEGYVEGTLAGMPERLRRRYLEGLWEFTEGNGFFDPDALTYYEKVSRVTPELLNGRTMGDPAADFKARRRKTKPEEPIKIRAGGGPLTLWKKPVVVRYGPDGERLGPERYVMGVDVSSGGSFDYSAIQVVSVDSFEQVAEWQGKTTPAELATVVYQLGRVFNNALAAVEVTGGWGAAVQERLHRELNYPNMYTRRMWDRLARKFTDKLGWDTTINARARMLDSLEGVLREREFGLFSMRTVMELHTFVYDEKTNKPQAQEGCNDDLVVALAIAVTVALEQPRELRRQVRKPHQPLYAATGY